MKYRWMIVVILVLALIGFLPILLPSESYNRAVQMMGPPL